MGYGRNIKVGRGMVARSYDRIIFTILETHKTIKLKIRSKLYLNDSVLFTLILCVYPSWRGKCFSHTTLLTLQPENLNVDVKVYFLFCERNVSRFH